MYVGFLEAWYSRPTNLAINEAAHPPIYYSLLF